MNMTNKKNNNASSLITKDKSYAYTPGSKYITVSTWDGSGKNGYSNKYIPKTSANLKKIFEVAGKPEKYGKRWLWF